MAIQQTGGWGFGSLCRLFLLGYSLSSPAFAFWFCLSWSNPCWFSSKITSIRMPELRMIRRNHAPITVNSIERPRVLRNTRPFSASQKIFPSCSAAQLKSCRVSEPCNPYLLERRQMWFFSASRINSSRNWGWATEIMASAFSQVERPFRFTMPYSVTR